MRCSSRSVLCRLHMNGASLCSCHLACTHPSHKMDTETMTMAKLRQRYDDLKERYAVSDVTVSLQNVASQLGYSSIDSLRLEDMVVEIVSRIEKLMQAKTMMEAAGKPE
ncbi:uncharacterized protein LOC123450887 [Hordeum vulgare subsp. vulgare]|uniref:uncharacterized protein LOC123450887 n=1 Tax=Hordeum vulgare subsp. vulgare TaxID=112509 RepID=UPI00162E2443|nr:uncharacterized protein LOC123450887 [Hordeum vulgare subsp. vulgare]